MAPGGAYEYTFTHPASEPGTQARRDRRRSAGARNVGHRNRCALNPVLGGSGRDCLWIMGVAVGSPVEQG